MTPFSFALAAAPALVLWLGAAAANGEELKAYEAKPAAIGGLRGTLYFAPRDGEYSLVATFDGGSRPLRWVATLQPGQRIELSSPGETASVIVVRRDGDRVTFETLPRSTDPAPSPDETDILSGP